MTKMQSINGLRTIEPYLGCRRVRVSELRI